MVEKTEVASPATDDKSAEAAAAAATQDSTGASSTPPGSDSTDKKAPEAEAKTGIDIVRDVLGLDAANQPVKKETSPPSPSDAKDKSDKPPGDAAPATDAKLKTEEVEGDVLEQADKVQFRDHPVFKKVTGELKTTRDERDAAKAEVEKVQPQIKFATDFATTMKETGISAEALGGLIQIGALIINDPAKARDEVAKVLDELDDALGNKLPDDLRKKVEAGDIDREDALEISRARALKKRADADAAAAAKPDPKPATQPDDEVKKLQTSVKAAVTVRVDQIAKSDTEFAKKEAQLGREVAFLANQRQLKSVDDAIKLVNDAYANVNKFYADLKPAPKDINANGGKNGAEPSSAKTASDLPPTASGLDVTRAALGLPPLTS